MRVEKKKKNENIRGPYSFVRTPVSTVRVRTQADRGVSLPAFI